MRKFKKRSKKTGKYKSKLEAKVAKILGKKAVYEPEKLDYILRKKYVPDFVVTAKDGSKIYYEVKGYLRYEDQAKMKAVKEYNPELDIIFYFARDNKVQSSRMKASEWCERYGFKYEILK